MGTKQLVHAVVATSLMLVGVEPARGDEPEQWSQDACGDSGLSIQADAVGAARTVYWSCLGLALDLPPGMSAATASSDGLSGLTVEVEDTADPPNFLMRIVGTRLDYEPEQALDLHFGEQFPVYLDRHYSVSVKAAGPVKKTAHSVSRVFQDKVDDRKVAAYSQLLILDDGLHQLAFSAHSLTWNAKVLTDRVRALTKVRPITAAEWDKVKRYTEIVDWDKALRGRRVPISEANSQGKTTQLVAFCPDGTFRVFDPEGRVAGVIRDVPGSGRWRVSRTALWLGATEYWHVDGIHRDYGTRYVMGPLGSSNAGPPYEPAGELCRAGR